VIFYPGTHRPNHGAHLPRAFISINVVRERSPRKPIACPDWIMDSGAFTELSTHGKYRQAPAQYAQEVLRFAAHNPGLTAVVTQDWMCEPFVLARTGLTVADHQRHTIERYDALLELLRGVRYLMPVLQGQNAEQHVAHLAQYGDRLKPGMWVGVGSVCKINSTPHRIEIILTAIKQARPDLRLHGFGLKTTALASELVRRRLYSADSMAWSYAARKQGRNQNDVNEALAFLYKIENQRIQGWLF
jgi:hypothetical protein